MSRGRTGPPGRPALGRGGHLDAAARPARAASGSAGEDDRWELSPYMWKVSPIMAGRAEPEMDLESLVAIDVHTHAEVSSRGGASLDDTLNDASAAYFKVDAARDRKSTRLNSSHLGISYAVFCLKKKKNTKTKHKQTTKRQ